jgi:hypothetical protein
VNESKWQPARLIPVAGVKGDREAEQRATSAFLAVLSVVRDLSNELLTPMGASSAAKAVVETYTEVPVDSNGKTVRPDGLVRVTYGKRSFTALVEVKTGNNKLRAEQINDYWQAARQAKFDHVVTISNEIAASGAHPVHGLKFQRNSPVQVTHLSWIRILSTALRLKNHKGVDDPEQAWILGELVRYLEHHASGVMQMSDMGSHWIPIRDGARAGTLNKKTEGLTEVVEKIDEMFTFVSLVLSSEIGEDVDVVLSKGMQDQAARIESFKKTIIEGGTVSGTLRIPHTAGDIRTSVDLRSQQLTASIDVKAPEEMSARARTGWILKQVLRSGDDVAIESYARNARLPTAASLGEVREDRSRLLDSNRSEPHRFVLKQRAPMPLNRKSKKQKAGFVDGYMNIVADFYENVVQGITPWQAPAPKRKPAETEPESDAIQLDRTWSVFAPDQEGFVG